MANSASSVIFFPYTRKLLHYVQSRTQGTLELIGSTSLSTVEMAGFLLKGRLSWKEFMNQAAFVGTNTLGIALILTTFAGMVIALQLSKEMAKQGAGNYVGALVSMALLRELSPVLTAFSVLAMAGSAYAAELSTMQITKQVDALKMLHMNPTRYLMLPRVAAGVFAVPLMTIITTFSGIMGGMVISMLLADIPPANYLDSVWHQTEIKDIAACIFKAGVFGYLIMILSTSIGINTHGGAKEVGTATTRAVVWSFMVMAILITYNVCHLWV